MLELAGTSIAHGRTIDLVDPTFETHREVESFLDLLQGNPGWKDGTGTIRLRALISMLKKYDCAGALDSPVGTPPA